MNINDIFEMLKNPQAIQAQAEELKRRTASIEATGSSGGGLVRITLTGTLDMKSCSIAPEAVDPSDLGLLQDLVRAAYNDAAAKVREEVQRSLSSGLGGLPIPPGLFGGGGL